MEILTDLSRYQHFFQQNSSYYIDKVQKFNEGKYFTFNLPAFLLGFIWFLYRKMYLEAFLLLAVIFAESALEEYLRSRSELDPQTLAGQLISTLIISTILGFTANYFYIRKANKTIRKSMEKYKDAEKGGEYLERKGGTSYVLVIILTILIVGFVVLNNSLV